MPSLDWVGRYGLGFVCCYRDHYWAHRGHHCGHFRLSPVEAIKEGKGAISNLRYKLAGNHFCREFAGDEGCREFARNHDYRRRCPYHQ